VGTFRYPVGVGDAAGQEFIETMPLVDTGALYSQLPADLLEGLGHSPNARRWFRLADGTTIERPVGPVPLRINNEVQTVLCIFGEEGSELLLGAVTLETFSLAPDPVNETLVPVVAMLAAMDAVEEPLALDDRGLIPAIIQDHETNDVLMVGWMNEESLRLTRGSGQVWFWSRSRRELWHKGETSGDFLEVQEMWTDCDRDVILVKARMLGTAVCHTGARSCFFNELSAVRLT
jgi:phosphoribosyl-AMP cyclohydrolase/predicted aspartyl protease